jgi:hypothetical protein
MWAKQPMSDERRRQGTKDQVGKEKPTHAGQHEWVISVRPDQKL